ncbi:MAG TPA: hypothetical protein VFG73_02195 [Rhodanobacteraceae bacterium]|nr:hypothetical protein [Rhodanobacteraceae bacterium]
MAVEQKFLVPINLNGQELRNAALQSLATAPTSAVGRVYFDTALVTGRYYNGSEWVPLDARKATNIPIAALATNPLARANHTGTQPASTISDLAAVVQTYRLDQFAAPTSALNINSQRLTNVATPTSDADAAPKSYVDAQVQTAAAGLDPKDSVVAASTGDLTLSGAQTIDSVACAVGDRVLAKNQTDATENGIWIVAAGAWSRAADADQGTLSSGALVFVQGGTANAASQWYLQTADPVVVGTSDQNWVQFAAGQSYTNGNGLNLSGNTFSVKPASGGGIDVGAGGVAVDATVPRIYSATIGDGSTTSFAVVHNLGTRDVIVQMRDTATHQIEVAAVTATSTTTVTVDFVTAPANGAYRVTVIGA